MLLSCGQAIGLHERDLLARAEGVCEMQSIQQAAGVLGGRTYLATACGPPSPPPSWRRTWRPLLPFHQAATELPRRCLFSRAQVSDQVTHLLVGHEIDQSVRHDALRRRASLGDVAGVDLEGLALGVQVGVLIQNGSDKQTHTYLA